MQCMLYKYTTGKQILLNIWKADWKHPYLRFWLDRKVVAPTANKCCHLNLTISCSVMEENCNLQCLKLKLHNTIRKNIIFNTSPKMSHIFPGNNFHNVKMWEYFCVFNNLLLTSRTICLWLPDDNLSSQKMTEKNATQCAVFCHLLS